MTQPERTDFLNTDEAAEQLGVSPMRIRQMITNGELPSTKLGERSYMWHRADIDAVKARRSGEPTSLASGLLNPPTQPLRRVVENLVDISAPASSEPGALHVRVWAGSASEGYRTVVLLGELRETRGVLANPRVEELLHLVAPMLPVRPREAVWFSYRPRDEEHPHRTQNLIWRFPSDEESDNTLVRSRVRFLFRRRPPDVGRAPEPSPFRRPASLLEVERVVGSPVEAYPAGAYTRHTVEAWRSAGATVSVPHDTIEQKTLITAAHTLAATSITGDPEHGSTAQEQAVHMLVDEVRQRHAWINQKSWDDGTEPPDDPSRTADWPTTWAARLIKPRLTEHDQRLLDAHPDPFTIPHDPAEHTALHETLDALRSWDREVDPYSDEPDHTLHTAIERAAQLLAFYIGIYDETFADTDHADTEPRHYEVVGPWDAAYLDQLRSANLTTHRRAYRLLNEFLRRNTGMILPQWGIDPAGRLVGYGASEWFGRGVYAVAWPLRPPADSIPAGTRIVADSATTGDRPVYLAYPDGFVRLLPADPRVPHSGWSFGYDGGSSGALCQAILTAFARADGVARNEMPHTWIDDQVCHASNDTLDIAVDELRRQYPVTSEARCHSHGQDRTAVNE